MKGKTAGPMGIRESGPEKAGCLGMRYRREDQAAEVHLE